MLDEGTPNPPGEALVDELRWIHGIIRDNLTAIRALTDQVATGVPAAQLQAQLRDLAATNIVWTLRTGCLRYCRLVHGHHQAEDTHFFPGLRRVDPALRPVIDKLEADHLAIAGQLDAVEAAAARLRTDEAARAGLAVALTALADGLLVHLDYEEANLNPTLRRLTGWPFA
jgi:hypothetical protein